MPASNNFNRFAPRVFIRFGVYLKRPGGAGITGGDGTYGMLY